MKQYTYTWDSAPESVIVWAKDETEAFKKVAKWCKAKYSHGLTLQEIVDSVPEEGVLAEVQATIK